MGIVIFLKITIIYINNTSEKDILALYNFDKHLHNIVYKYAMIFESRFKSIVSYVFSKYHGEDHRQYLVRENFDKDENKNEHIENLINRLTDMIANGSNKQSGLYRDYIGHYIEKYNYVPLWVLVRCMTMGDVSKFYANMKLAEKNEVAKEFSLTASHLEVMVKMLVSFRNTVAHDERLFCKKETKRNKLPYNLDVFDIMRIEKTSAGVPKSGVSDFLSLMIVFKYLLNQLEFSGFWTEFEIERGILIENIKSHFVAEINNKMGLKNRWKNLKNYKIIAPQNKKEVKDDESAIQQPTSITQIDENFKDDSE